VAGREHAGERGEIAAALEVEKFHEQVRLSAGDPVGSRRRRAQAGQAQRAQAVRCGGERARVLLQIALQEAAATAYLHPVAVVDAAAGCRRLVFYAELSS
jgi:hypothetical protein